MSGLLPVLFLRPSRLLSLPAPPHPHHSSRRPAPSSRLLARAPTAGRRIRFPDSDSKPKASCSLLPAMGISKVTGIAATTLLVTSLALRKAGAWTVATAPILATSCVAYVVTVASHTAVNVPWILGKSPSGRFPLWSAVLFGPFLVLARNYAKVKRFLRKENVYDEIAQGLYLGGWPFVPKHLPPGDPSVVDCTCELPRSGFVNVDEYICLATWDTRAPAPSQIEFAARWACEKRAQGKPVYVHCAFASGHGRSACVMCAILVAMGIAENWKDAENIIRGRRKIKMNALHRKTLEDWSKSRVVTKKEN